MGAAESKTSGPKFADEFYRRSHRRVERPLRRQFAAGINYNSTNAVFPLLMCQ